MNLPLDILLAVSSLVVGFAIASALASWTEKVFPTIALAALTAGVGVFIYAFNSLPDPQGWREVPNAFISVVARILN
jgi:hypothetical protein